MLAHSPSEVRMVTPYEGSVNSFYSGGVGSTVIMTGIFSPVMCCSVRGANHICVGVVDVDEVWVVFVGVGVTFSAAVLDVFANFYKASPRRPRKV